MINGYPTGRMASVLMLAFTALIASAPALASSVTLKTVMGDIVIELYEEETPETVANFLNYVRDGDFNSSFVHRSDPGFIIQGGAYTFVEGVVTPIPTDPTVVNEPGISNLRGTIAMAKRSGDPNSATSQWFINLADNAAILDDQNGGFTVFGEVTGNGMDVVDSIAALPPLSAGIPCLGCPPLTELPLRDLQGGGAAVTEEYLVMMVVSENSEFQINQGLNDCWYTIATNGQGVVIVTYPELKTMFLTWFTYDTVRPDELVPFMLGEPGHRWMTAYGLSLIHISEPTRQPATSRMPSSA